MCPFIKGSDALLCSSIYFCIKIFLLVWIIFVPTVVTARLDKIIKLLKDKEKK